MHRKTQRLTIPCRSDFSRDAPLVGAGSKSIATEVAPTVAPAKVVPAEVAFVDINWRIGACFPIT